MKRAHLSRLLMSSNSKPKHPPSSSTPSDGGRGGIQFGTGIAYNDAYGDDSTDHQYVESLPTLEEEQQLLRQEQNDVKLREEMEELDQGRMMGGGASHPSSRGGASKYYQYYLY